MAEKAKSLSRQEELMHVLDFTEAELEANRQGRMDSEHLKRVYEREEFAWAPSGMIGLILLAAAAFIVSNQNLLALILSSVFAIIGLISLRAAWRNYSSLKQDKERGLVDSVQGLAIIGTSSSSSHLSNLTINKLGFNMAYEALLRIKHLEPHRVYYLPKSKVVVSVERLESEV